jgi:hypothetical protein
MTAAAALTASKRALGQPTSPPRPLSSRKRSTSQNPTFCRLT